MQSDINNSKFPGMWLTVGKQGITLYASFKDKMPVLTVRNRIGLWWSFKQQQFIHDREEKLLQKGELAALIKFFTYYGGDKKNG